MVYTLKDGDKEPDPKNAISLYLKSKGGFFPSVTNLNTPDVGYSCVIEEAFDKDNKSQGYIVRHYSNYNEDIMVILIMTSLLFILCLKGTLIQCHLAVVLWREESCCLKNTMMSMIVCERR